MSDILDHADQLAVEIRTFPEFLNLPPDSIIVDRQKRINETLLIANARSCGLAIVIGAPSSSNADRRLSPPRLLQKYAVMVFAHPEILKARNYIPAMDAVESLIRNIHFLKLGNDPARCYEWEYVSHRLVANKTFLIYQVDFETYINLYDPPIT